MKSHRRWCDVISTSCDRLGWSGSAMVPGKLIVLADLDNSRAKP